MRKIVCSTVTLVLIYANLVVLSTLSNPHVESILDRPSLPIPTALYDLFLLPHMFLSYSPSDQEPIVEGVRFVAGQSASVLRLNLDEFLPFSRGVQILRLSARKFLLVHGKDAQRRAQAALAAQIRQRYNRENPSAQIQAVRFGVLAWSVGTSRPPNPEFELWYSEES